MVLFTQSENRTVKFKTLHTSLSQDETGMV
jgi:hypothetical protein